MREDDGGLTWLQALSLAEAAKEALDDLYGYYSGPDEQEVMGTYLNAEIHLSRLIKRAKVMIERKAGGDA